MISEKELDEKFEEWFTMPLDGFSPEMQKIIKETARLAFKKGAECMLVLNIEKILCNDRKDDK